MKLLYIKLQFLALIFIFNHSLAQSVKPLKVGDKVPDIVLAKMLFHKAPNGKLSDFDGKAIIIDQWFINCIPCVSAMPKLDSIQKVFATDLQILPVTFEKHKKVVEFWEKNIRVKGIKLAQVVEDTLVRSYFPAVSFPQQIWINKSGIITAITDGSHIKTSNIVKLIKNEKLDLQLKQDELDVSIRLALHPSMLIRYEENKSRLLHYSYFSKYRKEFSGFQRSTIDTVNSLVRITASNSPMYRMYDFAYANGSFELRNFSSRFIRKDTRQIRGLNKDGNDTASLFCYDLIYPGKKANNLSKYMVPDLDNFFGLKSHEELLDVPCFVISPNGKGTKYKEFNDSNSMTNSAVDLIRLKKVVANGSYPWLLGASINNQSEHLVLFELEGVKKVNFEVNWNLEDLKLMNTELANYDLKIEKTVRKRKVIILEDK